MLNDKLIALNITETRRKPLVGTDGSVTERTQLVVINVNYNGKQMSIFRTKAQFKQDLLNSPAVSADSDVALLISKGDFKALAKSGMTADLDFVSQGEPVLDEKGDVITSKESITTKDENGNDVIEIIDKEMTYSQDGLKVNGFITLYPSLEKQIASAIADRYAASIGL